MWLALGGGKRDLVRIGQESWEKAEKALEPVIETERNRFPPSLISGSQMLLSMVKPRYGEGTLLFFLGAVSVIERYVRVF